MSEQGDDKFDGTIKLTLTSPNSRTHSRLVVLSGLRNELVKGGLSLPAEGLTSHQVWVQKQTSRMIDVDLVCWQPP